MSRSIKPKSIFFPKSSFVIIPFLIFALNLIFLVTFAYSNEVTLAWAPNTEPDLAGYIVYYKTEISGEPYDGTDADQGPSGIILPIEELNDSSNPEITLTGLENDKDYYFVLAAYDARGFESEYSNEASTASDLSPPSIPSDLSGTSISLSRIDLAWNDSIDSGGAGVAGYYIFRDGIKIGETSIPSYSDTGLAGSTQYIYTVTAYDYKNNESAHSDSISLTTLTPETRTITSSASAGGSLTPSGPVTVNYGADQTVSILPDAGYHIVDVLIDGVSVGPVSSYTFTNVTADHTLSASFALENQAPLTNAGPDQNVPEGVLVKLSGANSIDLDDGIASFFWEQTGGATVNLSDPMEIETSFISPSVSSYGEALIFRLTAIDYAGLEFSDYCIVNVSSSNIPPVSDAGPDKIVGEGATVYLDATNSVDTDGGIATYKWNQIGGTPVILSDTMDVQPSFITPSVGPEGQSLVFELTVIDNGRLQSQDTCIVNVTWQNNPPVANAGENQVVDTGSTVTLDASNSLDSDTIIASFYWAQISGAPVTFSDPTAVQSIFTAPDAPLNGEPLIFHLTVTDTHGLKQSDTCEIDVHATGFVGDLDGDGGIDCNDYLRFATAYNSCNGDKSYIALADPDGDGCITDVDREILFPFGVKICDLSARAKRNRVTLEWTHVGADIYNIYRKIEGEEYTFLANTISADSNYLDKDVINGLTYYYLVTGEFSGLESNDSNEVSSIPQAPGRIK